MVQFYIHDYSRYKTGIIHEYSRIYTMNILEYSWIIHVHESRVSINAYAKFGQKPSNSSQDIERKWNSDINQGS